VNGSSDVGGLASLSDPTVSAAPAPSGKVSFGAAVFNVGSSVAGSRVFTPVAGLASALEPVSASPEFPQPARLQVRPTNRSHKAEFDIKREQHSLEQRIACFVILKLQYNFSHLVQLKTTLKEINGSWDLFFAIKLPLPERPCSFYVVGLLCFHIMSLVVMRSPDRNTTPTEGLQERVE
jgi:hypothetical protein